MSIEKLLQLEKELEKEIGNSMSKLEKSMNSSEHLMVRDTEFRDNIHNLIQDINNKVVILVDRQRNDLKTIAIDTVKDVKAINKELKELDIRIKAIKPINKIIENTIEKPIETIKEVKTKVIKEIDTKELEQLKRDLTDKIEELNKKIANLPSGRGKRGGGGGDSSSNRVQSKKVTSDYTMTNNDHDLFVDTDSGNVTITLPKGTQGRNLRIINTGTSGNSAILTPKSTDNLVGENTTLSLFDKEVVIITYDTNEGWW